MEVYVGCDVGTVTIKAALFSPVALPDAFFMKPEEIKAPTGGFTLYLTKLRRIHGKPLDAAAELIAEIESRLPDGLTMRVNMTGSGARAAAKRLGVHRIGDFKALAAGVAGFHPDARAIIEMGGENSRFLRIEVREGGGAGIVGYGANGDCAAGTGSFMDQQATRLGFAVDEAGQVAHTASRSAKIAGRCSVFAKSDMIHAQQKGSSPAQVLRGLCDAVARSFKAGPAGGFELDGKMVFVGGVARNPGVARALREVFNASEDELVAAPHPEFYGAIGAALLLSRGQSSPDTNPAGLKKIFESWPRLDVSGVRFLAEEEDTGPNASIERGYLGVDIGSVSTNLVLIDVEGNLVDELYLRTRARPVEVVTEGLAMLKNRNGEVKILGVATTGSGRDLIGELIGADAIHDEITAHKTGAFNVADRHLDKQVDTIFEIGGQDAKFIRLKNGVVVDFAMNEACAAGTGSFLEEQAEKLGISIINEFSSIALAAEEPLRMGERCTVYMESDVVTRLREGATKENVIAGLAYSVVQNYLNRVARGRPVGDVIFFQGGTAYNRSVAAAFSKVLGKTIIVPPHNGVMGAYGAALLARDRMSAMGKPSTFRGFDLTTVNFTVNEFTCHSCDNSCDVQAFTVEGKKTFWGDKCSEKYRREAKTDLIPVAENLIALRAEALEADYFGSFIDEGVAEAVRAGAAIARRGQKKSVGMIRAMYYFDRFPFWRTYFNALGHTVLTSGQTTRKVAESGVEASVAEPCFPIQAAHGHLIDLVAANPDHIVIPSHINAETPETHTASHACPWGQTLPFVLKASPAAEGVEGRIHSPVVHFREGPKFVERELWNYFNQFASSRRHHADAVALAYLAQERFTQTLQEAGAVALAQIKASGRQAVVLLGRPYNVNDPGMNLNIPAKVRKFYGIDVIPMDFLPTAGVLVGDLHPNMYWNYGRRILAAARWSADMPWLHPIYLTNFKCGPDSFIKTFASEMAGKPYLTLQFDAHGNDAGMLTRVEAYLDSKGFLRWWTQNDQNQSAADESMCPGCATDLPGFSPQHSVR